MLQEYLKDAVTKLDSQIEGKVAPAERMRRLLTAKDKKATLLEMAGQPVQQSSPLPIARCPGVSDSQVHVHLASRRHDGPHHTC